MIAYLCVCSMEEGWTGNHCTETDSDTADKQNGTKVKWTKEEVSARHT